MRDAYESDVKALGYIANSTKVFALRPGLEPAEVAMMAFAEQVTARANTVTRGDIEGQRRHGFSDPEILDIALTAAARCVFSKVLDGVGAAPDRERTRR